MKKYLVLLFVVLLANTSPAQLFKGFISLGMNISQVDGDEVYGFNRIGLNSGVGVEIALNDKWSVSLENLYSQKGAFQKKQFEDSISGEYNLRLNYAEVPLLLHYNDKNRLKVGAGLSWGRLVREKEIEQGGLVAPYTDTVPFRVNDFSIIADLRFRLYRKIKLNIRYSYSLASIRERNFYSYYGDVWERKQYNNLLTIRLLYVINEKTVAKQKPENE